MQGGKIMSIAIITGASSGLGKEFLKQTAAVYPEIEEIWVIARRLEKLEELQEDLPNYKIVPIKLDLTEESAYISFQDCLAKKRPDIKLMINNAGFGKLCDFAETPYRDHMLQCDLNVRALTVMTNLVLPYMRPGAAVIEVCSIAAFVPTPNMTVYCSTKAYVLSFAKALRTELRSRKINVLAVCPGPMATEFLDVAEITGNSKLFDSLPYCQADQVAYKALRAAKKGRGVYTNKVLYKVYRVLGKILPHNWMMHFTKA